MRQPAAPWQELVCRVLPAALPAARQIVAGVDCRRDQTARHLFSFGRKGRGMNCFDPHDDENDGAGRAGFAWAIALSLIFVTLIVLGMRKAAELIGGAL